jgi:hypothetical protein
MPLHTVLLGCLGDATVDVRSGAATSRCGMRAADGSVQMVQAHCSSPTGVRMSTMLPRHSARIVASA